MRNSSEDFQDWDPMDSDFSSLNFNSYDRGPGQDLAIDHLPSYAGRSNNLNERKTVTLYAGKIPHDLEEEALKNMFARHGKVLRLCIKRNATNCYGFIDYPTLVEAEKAITKLNGKPPLYLHVDFATTKEEREMKEKQKKEELESRFKNNPVSEIDFPSSQDAADTSTSNSQNLRNPNKGEEQVPDQVGNTLTNLKITTGNQGRVVSCDFVEALSLQQCNPSHFSEQNLEIFHNSPVEMHQTTHKSPDNINFQKGYGRGIRPYFPQFNKGHYNEFERYSAFQSSFPVCGRGHHYQNRESQEYRPLLPTPNVPVPISNSCGNCCCNHFPSCYEHTSCMNVPPQQFCHAQDINSSRSSSHCCHHYSQSRYIIRQSGPGKVEYVTSSYNCQPASYSIPSLLPVQCFVCKKEGKLRCSRCETPYCSEECQRKDWPLHKAKCMQTDFQIHSERPRSIRNIPNAELRDSCYVSGASNSESTCENKMRFRYSESGKQAKKHRSVEKKYVKDQNISDSSQSSDGKERPLYNSSKPRQNYKNKSEGIQRELPHSKTVETISESGKVKDIPSYKTNSAINIPSSKTNSAVNISGSKTNRAFSIPDSKTNKAVNIPGSKTNSAVNIHIKKVNQKLNDTVSENASSGQMSRKHVKDKISEASSFTEKNLNTSLLPNNSSCPVTSDLAAEITDTVRKSLFSEKQLKKSKANEIKWNILNVGKCEKVTVSHINSPDEIWVQLVKDQETLCKIESEMKTLSKEKVLKDPSVNDICASLYYDNGLYRAKISQVFPDKTCEVYYIDYGNTEVTPVSDLFYLNETLPAYAAQAILCKLADIKPPNNAKKWSDSDLKALSVLVNVSANFKANVINSSPDKYAIDLIMEDGTSIAELLVNEHNADWISEEKHSLEDSESSKDGSQNSYSTTQHIPSVLQLLKDKNEIKLLPLIIKDSSFWAWVIIDNMIDSFKAIESSLGKRSVGMSDAKMSVEQGNYAASFSPCHQSWYRSYILHAGNTFLVRYVDYGNEEEVSQVCTLAPDQLVCSPLLHCVANKPFSSEMKKLLEGASEILLMQGVLKCFSEEVVQLDIINNSKIICQLKGFPWYHGLTINKCFSNAIIKTASKQTREIDCSAEVVINESPKSITTRSFTQGIMKDSIEEMELSTTSQTKVKVVWWNSVKELYVQKISDEQHRCAMMEKINLHCNSQSSTKYIPVEGEIVFSKFSFDNQWYRSCVLKIMGVNKCHIFLIDYGNEEEVSFECIQHLPKEFAFPRLCACVSLHGIPDEKISLEHRVSILDHDVWSLEVVDSLACPKSINLFTSNSSLLDFLYGRKVESVEVISTCSNRISTDAQEVSEATILQRPSLKSKTDLFNQAAIQIVYNEREKLFVHRVEDKNDLLSMMQAINEEYNNHSKTYIPIIDDIVSAKYKEDGCWYRGCILEILEGRKCKILFVDYGNTDEVMFDNIQPLNQRFISIPLFTIPVNLDGVPTEIFTQEVSEMLKSREWQLKIVDKISSPAKVKLFDKKKSCINNYLYDKNFSLKRKKNASAFNNSKDLVLYTDEHNQVKNKITLSCLKQIALTLNHTLEVKLVWKENEKLFVQRTSDKPDIEIMLKKLEQHCSEEVHSSYTPVKGEIVSAKCCFDNKWYRGCIVEILSENEYSVCYIDYGNSALVPKNDIRDLPRELISYPIFCIDVKFIEEESSKLDINQIYQIEAVDVVAGHYAVRVLNSNLYQKVEANNHNIPETSSGEVNCKSNEESFKTKFLFNEYSSVELPCGENVDIVVYSITYDGNIHCTPYNEKNFEDLFELEKQISDFCAKHPADSYTPIESEMVLAKSSDGEWHRATVVSVSDGPIYDVYMVDFGGLEELNKECLKEMDEQFMSLPLQAHICKLGGVSLIKEREEEAIDELFKIVPCLQRLRVTVVRDEFPFICIPSVNEQLLQKGLAQPLPLCEQPHPSASPSTQTVEQNAVIENIIKEYQEMLIQQLEMMQRHQ